MRQVLAGPQDPRVGKSRHDPCEALHLERGLNVNKDPRSYLIIMG